MLAPSVLVAGPTETVIAPVVPVTQQEAPQKAIVPIETRIVEMAEEYHQDGALALKIIQCESRMYNGKNNQNLDKDGNVWSTDIGPWQINNYYHQARMLSLGLDIYDTEDNLHYGFMLLTEQGTQPWKASAYCWKK